MVSLMTRIEENTLLNNEGTANNGSQRIPNIAGSYDENVCAYGAI
jgi:hypothetical protein